MEFTGFHCSQHGLAPIPWRIVPNPRNFDHFTSRWTTLNWCDQVGRHWTCAWGNCFFLDRRLGIGWVFFWCRSCGQVLMQFNFRNSALRQRVDLRAGHRWRKAMETAWCQLSAPGFDGVKYSVKRPLRRNGHGTWKGRANWEATLGNGKKKGLGKKEQNKICSQILYIQWFAFMFTYLRSEFVYVISFLRPLICRKDMDMSICFELMWYIVQRPLKSLNRVTG